jgi:hypothetical protein
MKLAVAAIAVLVAVPVSLHAQSRTETRVIEENLTAYVPLALCGVPGIARRIAESAAIPAGIESVPDCRNLDPLPPPREQAEQITFLGMTVAAALDRLMTLDPRYRWTESDGVIVVRPLEAWTDSRHFLNTTMSDVGFSDQAIGNVANLVSQAMHSKPLKLSDIEVPGRTEQANLHFSIAPRPTSIIEFMNAVVRAHGALAWTVGYCRPARKPEYVSFMLWTFDRGGAGGGPKPVLDQNGKMHIDCPSPPRSR